MCGVGHFNMCGVGDLNMRGYVTIPWVMFSVCQSGTLWFVMYFFLSYLTCMWVHVPCGVLSGLNSTKVQVESLTTDVTEM